MAADYVDRLDAGRQLARDLGASPVILAAPVAPSQARRFLKTYVDDLVILRTPDPFLAIGQFYRDFDQVSDDEVIYYLRLAESSERIGG